MIDIWIVVGGIHYVAEAIVLKFLGFILPTYITCYYSCIANVLLYLCLTTFTFEMKKRWYLKERIQPGNKAVFITGCDSGFGHLLAKRLDSIGYFVFAGCLDENGTGAKELKTSSSKRLQIIEVDVTKDDSVNNALNFVEKNLGTSELWAIVNNAGIAKGISVELTELEEFREVMEVNAFGPVRVTKAFLPLLRKSRGRVINVTSIAGRVALPHITPYTMSKYAAVAFNDCLKQELDVWGIRVISIEPGFFRTRINDAEIFKKKMDMTYAKVKPEVREDYGEKYFTSLKYFFGQVCSTTSEKLGVVVDALDDAITLRYPDSVYRCYRNFISHVIVYTLERIPSFIVHTTINLCYMIRGFPKPRAAGKYS